MGTMEDRLREDHEWYNNRIDPIGSRMEEIREHTPTDMDDLLEKAREAAARILTADDTQSSDQSVFDLQAEYGVVLAEVFRQIDNAMSNPRPAHISIEGAIRQNVPYAWQIKD